MITAIQQTFRAHASPIRAKKNLQWFKLTDLNLPLFLGIMHDTINDFAKSYYRNFQLNDLHILLSSMYHEERMLGIKIAIKIYNSKKKISDIKNQITEIFHTNIDYFDQWDLIDTASLNIFTYSLQNPNSEYFMQLLDSNRWNHIRILLVSQIPIITKTHESALALDLCKKYLHHEHDLIQKAVGWLLKKAYLHCIGQRVDILDFIITNKNNMSKLTYRIANEKMDI